MAFLRGKADEKNPLAMEPPKELRQLLNMRDDEVCQLLGNAYGRVDAPLLFYKELSSQLEELGFIRHPLEPCVFLLYTQDTLNGILGIHVDDGVCGGDATFLQKIQALQKTLPFGSRKFRDFVFTGIRFEQMPDFTIRASQAEYIRHVLPIDVGRNRRQTPEAPATEEERSKLRGLVGSVQYAVTHTRPDVAAKLGEIQSQITTATVQTLLSANRVLREAQEFDQVCIHYLSIPVDRLTFVSFGDASFASSKNLNSHQGVIICATDDRLSKNQETPLSPLAWVSKKIPRVVRSTLSAEAYAMSKAVDLLGWLRALWGVVHVPQFDWRRPDQGYKLLNPALVVTDCKSLYDLVTRLAMPSCEEHRTTLEVLLIKQRCEENALFRWIPTTLQVADSLTKNMDASLLRAILAQGRFRLFDTSESLAKDAQRRKAIEKICAALSQAVLAGLAGVFLALAMDRWRHSWRHHVVGLVALCMVVAIALASAALQHNGSRMALNWLGAFVSGFLTIHWYPIHGALLPGKSDELILAQQRLLLLIAASFFYLMEVDRVNGQSRAEEAVQLRRGFRGSIAHATCSKPDDAGRIHAEIGTQTEDVDYAIQVLLTAGMSTPTLRDVARAGVGIQDAGVSDSLSDRPSRRHLSQCHGRAVLHNEDDDQAGCHLPRRDLPDPGAMGMVRFQWAAAGSSPDRRVFLHGHVLLLLPRHEGHPGAATMWALPPTALSRPLQQAARAMCCSRQSDGNGYRQ
eukprot:s4135_g4.t1